MPRSLHSAPMVHFFSNITCFIYPDLYLLVSTSSICYKQHTKVSSLVDAAKHIPTFKFGATTSSGSCLQPPFWRHRSDGLSSSSGSCSDGTYTSPYLKCSSTPTTPTPYRASCGASSPRLRPMPLHCAPVARKLRFGMARLNWPAEQTNFFITILADECRAGNRMSTTLNQTSKDNVVRRMKDHTDRHWTWDMCRNKWDELKKWSCWKYLHTFSCLGYHPRTSVIQMPQAWWDARIKEKKIARVFKRIRLQREEDLDFIFVGMEPVNIGPNEDGGHEGGGGRAGVPTQYVDSDNSGELEADHDNSGDLEADHDHSGDMHRFSPPPPQPLRTASMTSASCGKRRSIDQMHSSSSMLEGFKHFYEDVSAWKKQKEASSASKKAEEDAEYETLLRELLDGGVDPESEEYYMASVVLENTAHRAAYRPLPTIKAKIAWIKRAYLRLIGQLPTF